MRRESMKTAAKKALQNRARVARFYERHGDLKKISVVMPISLWARIGKAAERAGVSRTQFVIQACREKMKRKE
jgi:macrodomain Ter protein organizer (MatP/YcbG family)